MSDRVVIVGGGYSIKEGIEKGLWSNLNKNNLDVWSLNYAFLTMPFLPNKQIWVDFAFFLTQQKEILKLGKRGVKLVSRTFGTVYKDFNIKTYDWSRKKEKDRLFIGSEKLLVGTFALSLAEELKYKKIYLLGYDFGTTSINNRNTHYYLSDNIRKPSLKGAYREEDGSLKNSIKEDYKKFNSDNIINVSMQSNIECFKKINYEDFFKEVK